MTLATQVPDGATVLIDTNPIIYLLEGNPLGEPFRSIFEAVDRGRIAALVTPITLPEGVTGPLGAGKGGRCGRNRRKPPQKPGMELAWHRRRHCGAGGSPSTPSCVEAP